MGGGARQLKAPFVTAQIGDSAKLRAQPAIMVALSEGRARGQSYIITAKAKTPDGVQLVGKVRTNPLTAGQTRARVVLLASCPGALEWEVRATPVDPTIATGGWLSLSVAPDLGCCSAIPCNGSLLLAGGPDAGSHRYESGTTATTTSVPSGARVTGYALLASGAGNATIVVDGGDLITVPASGSFQDRPEGLIGPCDITFAGNVASRWVSWRELG